MWGGRRGVGEGRTSVPRGLLCAVISVMAVVAPVAFGCSVSTGCNFDVQTVRPDFPVTVMHQGQPLRGAKVSVREVSAEKPQTLEFETDARGQAQVSNLKPGRWSLHVSYLGVSGGGSCLRVSRSPLRIPHRSLEYHWGDVAVDSDTISGLLIDSRPGNTGSRLFDRIRRLNVPIVGATLTLDSPTGGSVPAIRSDEKGEFSFGRVPDGVYVLRVEGGQTLSAYPLTRILIHISQRAPMKKLVLQTQDGESNCGDTSLWGSWR